MTTELHHGTSWEVMADWEPGKYEFPCVITDPPYGMDFQSTYGKDEEAREEYQAKISDDDSIEAALAGWARTMEAMAPFLAEQCEMYVFSHWHVVAGYMGDDGKYHPGWQDWLKVKMPKYGFQLKQLLVWNKGWPGIGDVVTNWGAGHEFIYYLKRGSRKMPYRRAGILNVDKVVPGKNIHPTEKPTGLLKILIEMSTEPGDWILDPYAGSGSLLDAARECGRNAVGVERHDPYYERASTRLSAGSLFDV